MRRKTPGELLVEQEIDLHGPMNFETFVSLALYHPRYGYYNQAVSPRGRKGDYFTSPQVSELFSEIMADVFVSMRDMMGTEQFSIVEWGSGDGEFLSGVLRTLEREEKLKGFRVWAVETSRRARDQLIRRLSRFPKCRVVGSLDEMDVGGGVEGCFFSNEFFDALPFRRLRRGRHGWEEKVVARENGELMEQWAEWDPRFQGDQFGLDKIHWREGQEIEIRPAASAWLAEWGPLLRRGAVITFDYGFPRSELYGAHHATGTWQCYSQHSVQTNPLEKIGRQDLTAHVDFTQLTDAGRGVDLEPALFCSQGIILTHLGQNRMEKKLAAQSVPERLHAIQGIQQLTHPQAMGENFWTLIQTKEMPLPDIFRAIPNRLDRLI